MTFLNLGLPIYLQLSITTRGNDKKQKYSEWKSQSIHQKVDVIGPLSALAIITV